MNRRAPHTVIRVAPTRLATGYADEKRLDNLDVMDDVASCVINRSTSSMPLFHQSLIGLSSVSWFRPAYRDRILSMTTTTPPKRLLHGFDGALNVLFSFIASFVPMAGLFLVIALPLASALVALRVECASIRSISWQTLGLSLVVTLQQF
jgi:hypothetical protein